MISHSGDAILMSDPGLETLIISIHMFICLSTACSPNKSSTGSDSDARRETIVKRAKRKESQQPSIAVEPKSIMYLYGTVYHYMYMYVYIHTFMYNVHIQSCIYNTKTIICTECRWDICVCCKGNPRVSKTDVLCNQTRLTSRYCILVSNVIYTGREV